MWRPSPTTNNSTGIGCYSLVGSNRFTSLSLTTYFARVTPSPQDHIRFQPGDVLGFYLQLRSRLSRTVSSEGVVMLTSPSKFASVQVWYASVAPTKAASLMGTDCPYSVGSDGALNSLSKAAPFISISTGKYIINPLSICLSVCLLSLYLLEC